MFSCNWCGEKFDHPGDFINHLEGDHDNFLKYECNFKQCNEKFFDTRKKFNNHLRKKHNDQAKKVCLFFKLHEKFDEFLSIPLGINNKRIQS